MKRRRQDIELLDEVDEALVEWGDDTLDEEGSAGGLGPPIPRPRVGVGRSARPPLDFDDDTTSPAGRVTDPDGSRDEVTVKQPRPLGDAETRVLDVNELAGILEDEVELAMKQRSRTERLDDE